MTIVALLLLVGLPLLLRRGDPFNLQDLIQINQIKLTSGAAEPQIE